jgi:acetyl-CoA carboxylase biotin carboxyl carrier protein
MDLLKVESLADILLNKGLTAIEVEESGLRIRLEKSLPGGVSVYGEPSPGAAPSYERVAGDAGGSVNEAALQEIPSPLVGVVYLAPSPESEPYVSLGQRVEKGQVLCIIDAMKMLNEVASPADGIVAEICVENGTVVDYGACLFRLREE